MLTSTSKPDILEVIADLSNDEVFTPPALARATLDLLPTEVWSNPDITFFDPATKTGIFLREITQRLLEGLATRIPDEQERLTHILNKQVFGAAITDLTAMMARRTLYCSKDASSSASAVRMAKPDGNVWFSRTSHDYVDGRCLECGASEALREHGDGENYAYSFIHDAGRQSLRKEFDMKFDVIVGNPPYQMDSDGGTRTLPLYNLFVEQAKALNPRYIAMIMPSRWMAGGLGLGEFRAEMLGDTRVRKLVDYFDAGDVFPGVEIKGGVCYFLWDRDNRGSCAVTTHRGDTTTGPVERQLDEYDVFVRESKALDILHKVLARGEAPMTDIMATNNEFGLITNFKDFRVKRKAGDIRVYAIKDNRRTEGYIQPSQLPKGEAHVQSWKVLIPKSYGAGETFPHQILGQPVIAEPPSCSTQTYVFAWTDTREAAESLESYVRTRFFRFLVALRKISQHAPKPTYAWVPQQQWDREWTDAALYAKYGLTTEEQDYVAEMVREMGS